MKARLSVPSFFTSHPALVTQIVAAACLWAIGLSCNTTEPPPPSVRTVELTAEDASCTEAWIRVRVTNGIQPPVDLRLTRDGQGLQTLRLTTADSLLIDEGLPNHPYRYKAYRLTDSRPVDSSDVASITTMDTTSHNFTWQIDTLGDGNSSVLYDVAIINDTLTYAVGEIYKRDSLGNWDPLPYNLVKWNGQQWELKRVTVQTRYGLVTAPLEGVFAFSASDIWVVATDPIHGDGNNWLDYDIRTILGDNNLSVSKAWGSSPSDMYFVGRSGNIVHYASGTWRRVESGTDVTLNDVWGGGNRWVGQNSVLVAASNKFEPGAMKLLRVKSNGTVDSLPWPMQDRRIHSVWFDSRSYIFTAGGGVFRSSSNGLWIEQPISLIFTDRIRGTSVNNIWAVGDFGIVAHFNGFSWHEFPEVRISGIYESLDVRSNLIMAVGHRGAQAVVLRGCL